MRITIEIEASGKTEDEARKKLSEKIGSLIPLLESPRDKALLAYITGCIRGKTISPLR